VDDAHVQVGDEQDDAGSGVTAADGDVVKVAVDARVTEPPTATRS
jgi:hypothetical protein